MEYTATSDLPVITNSPFFSIIIPTIPSNETLLADLLSSIKNQSFEQFECLVVTGRDYNVESLLPDSRFRNIRCKSEYQGIKRNCGIDQAKGTYIVFCDADDLIDCKMLDVFKQHAIDSEPDLIISRPTRTQSSLGDLDSDHKVLVYDGNDRVIDLFFGRYVGGGARPESSEMILDACWGRAYRRKLLNDKHIRFESQPLRAQDALFENDVALAASKVLLLPTYCGYFWRPNQNSVMRRWDSNFTYTLFFCEKLLDRFKKVPRRYAISLDKYMSNLLWGTLWTLRTVYKHNNNDRAGIRARFFSNLPKRSSICKLKPRKSKREQATAFCLSLGMRRLAMVIFLLV